MSKYRVYIASSRLWWVCQLVFAALVVMSVWSWQPYLFSWQWLAQLCLTLIVGLAVGLGCKNPAADKTVSVAENGEWIWLDDQQVANITSASRVSSWLLWINLCSQTGSTTRWCWIFKDAVSDDDYRRLARIIIHIQQKA